MSTVRIPHLSPQMHDLLFWKDVKMSGLVLGSILLAWFVLGSGLSPYSPAQLLSLLTLLVPAACLAWNTAAPLLKRQGPPVPRFLEEGISEEQGKQMVDKALLYINPVLGVVGKLVSGKDFKLTLMAGAASFLSFKVFGFLNPVNLFLVVVVLAFSLPKVYEAWQQDIDRILDMVMTKLKELYAKADDAVFKKIPRGTSPKKAE